jgi:hypothetical protein
MNYNEHYAVYVNKVKDYDFYTCRRALNDCHASFAAWGTDISESYAIRLWAEIDALRERQLKLTKVPA